MKTTVTPAQVEQYQAQGWIVIENFLDVPSWNTGGA